MGCLKNVFVGIGCLVAFVVVLAAALFFREPLIDAYSAVAGRLAGLENVEIAGPGRPSPEWAESARRKQEAMTTFFGPRSVTLNSAEVASLIEEGLDPAAAAAVDSVAVTLVPGRFLLEAVLVTDVWGRDALGMFSGILRPREPMRVGGPASVVRPGVISWAPDELSVGQLPIPGPVIRWLVNSLTGGSDGGFLLAAPVQIRDMEITTDEVTFYRQVR